MSLPPVIGQPDNLLLATAIGNTRLECQDLLPSYDLYYHQDWLKVTGYCSRFDELEALILKYFNCQLDWSNSKSFQNGRKMYLQSARSHHKIILAYNYLEEGYNEIVLDIPAIPLMELSEECAWNLCKELYALGLECARFDFAIDDYARGLSFDDIKLAGESGNFSGARTMRPFIEYSSGQAPIVTGFSVGSRQSERYLRIYDKEIQSRGTDNYTDCIRAEGEFKGNQAKQLFELFVLAETVEIALDIAAQHVVGIVDFIEKNNAHLDRCPRLNWWSKFVNAVGGTKRLRAVTVVRTISTIVNFIDRQVKRGLALLHICQGEIWFDKAIESWLSDAKKKFGHGERKFIERHNRLVAIDPNLALPIY
jgi:hypothetical protein